MLSDASTCHSARAYADDLDGGALHGASSGAGISSIDTHDEGSVGSASAKTASTLAPGNQEDGSLDGSHSVHADGVGRRDDGGSSDARRADGAGWVEADRAGEPRLIG